jgi:hypothetical protein
MTLEDISNGEYHYLSTDELEYLLDDLEDALITIKRELRIRSKYE